MAAAEDYLSYLLPANLCFWTDGSIATNFGPSGAGVLFYATSARTQYHFPFPTVQFHPANTAEITALRYVLRSLDGASNITPLVHSSPWLSLQTPSPPSPSGTLPLTSFPRMLCGQSSPLSLPI